MGYYAIDSYEPKPIRNELIEIFARRVADDYWYALVDTAFDHGLKQLNWVGNNPLAIYHQGRLAPLADASPILFPLSWQEHDQLERELTRLLHHCCGRPMLSFIRSRFEPEQLRERWQSVLEIETEDGQSFLLRFADTRVLPPLAEASEIWTRLASGLVEWLFIGREGGLKTLEMSPIQIEDDVTIQISDKALSKLLKSGDADALASALDEHFPELLPQGKGSAVHARLVQQASMAESYGLVGTTNLFALAVADFSTECRLLEHVKFSSWLSQQPWQTMPLEEALGDFLENHIMECVKI